MFTKTVVWIQSPAGTIFFWSLLTWVHSALSELVPDNFVGIGWEGKMSWKETGHPTSLCHGLKSVKNTPQWLYLPWDYLYLLCNYKLNHISIPEISVFVLKKTNLFQKQIWLASQASWHSCTEERKLASVTAEWLHYIYFKFDIAYMHLFLIHVFNAICIIINSF